MDESSSNCEKSMISNADLNCELFERKCLCDIKQWVENESEFNGRSDDDFLLMFLRSCEFDVEMTKTTLTHYYESRRDIPQWWSDKSVHNENISSLLQRKVMTAFKDGDYHLPTVFIATYSRFGENDGNFDDYLKMCAIYMDVIVRRVNSQKNGVIWLLDCRNYRWWFSLRLFSPIFAKRFIFSFYQALPMRIKGIILLNTPSIAKPLLSLLQTFAPRNMKGLIHLFGSDWSKLREIVPMEVIPEEYGGQAGPIDIHDDAFTKEVIAFNDYLVDDEKYGFQSN